METRCLKCGLSANFPRANFQEGVCRFCVDFVQRGLFKKKLSLDEFTLSVNNLVKSHSASGIMVALSGGKDSCYTLELLSNRLGIKCIAMLLDNGYISETARQNCNIICDATNTDLITIKIPKPQMLSYYRKAISEDVPVDTPFLQRASALCNGCISMVNNRALSMAKKFGFSIVAGGYIEGQIPSGNYYYELSPQFLSHRGINSDVSNPLYAPMIMMSPLVALQYDESEILEYLASIGWRRSNDTGAHSSNCRINDLGILNHKDRYNFHPYESELCSQVRNGTMSRDEAIKRIESKIDMNRVTAIKSELMTGAD